MYSFVGSPRWAISRSKKLSRCKLWIKKTPFMLMVKNVFQEFGFYEPERIEIFFFIRIRLNKGIERELNHLFSCFNGPKFQPRRENMRRNTGVFRFFCAAAHFPVGYWSYGIAVGIYIYRMYLYTFMYVHVCVMFSEKKLNKCIYSIE